MVAAFAGTSVANYAFSLLMGRLLLPGDFGALAFVQTLLLIAGLVLESGIPWSLAREMTMLGEGSQSADTQQARVALVRGAVISNLGLALGMSLLLLLLFAAGPLRAGLESWTITLLAAAALPLIALVGVARGAAQGSEQFGSLALVSASEVVGKAITGTLLVALGLGVAGAVAGFVIGALLAVLLGVLSLRGTLTLLPWGQSGTVIQTRPVTQTGRVIQTRPMTARMAGPMFGALLGSALLLNLDLMLLKVFPGGGRVASGQYQAAIVLANAPYFLASSVLVPLAFAGMAKHTTLAATWPELRRVLKLAALCVLPLELLLVLFPALILGLMFPASYAGAALALQWRAAGTALLIVVTLISAAYQASGHAQRAAWLLLSLSALEVLALLVAIPRAGVTGAATVFAGIMLLAVLGLGGHYMRQLLQLRQRHFNSASSDSISSDAVSSNPLSSLPPPDEILSNENHSHDNHSSSKLNFEPSGAPNR
jgi:O-antigen/teichoic acid export membrane protein